MIRNSLLYTKILNIVKLANVNANRQEKVNEALKIRERFEKKAKKESEIIWLFRASNCFFN